MFSCFGYMYIRECMEAAIEWMNTWLLLVQLWKRCSRTRHVIILLVTQKCMHKNGASILLQMQSQSFELYNIAYTIYSMWNIINCVTKQHWHSFTITVCTPTLQSSYTLLIHTWPRARCRHDCSTDCQNLTNIIIYWVLVSHMSRSPDHMSSFFIILTSVGKGVPLSTIAIITDNQESCDYDVWQTYTYPRMVLGWKNK